ncbi:hypothetical protein CK203_022540 [Vitis vinifera]|uniref:Uncharacterized protein n=1 Tax=Vitis vinifera TaxID=29760 RepID=A0A438JE74_VITVI|nr:hypothetical protein CK203_022540 [Vitis vinifera]
MTRDAYVQQSDDAMMKEVVLVRVVVLPFMVVVWFCWHWASDDSGINIVYFQDSPDLYCSQCEYRIKKLRNEDSIMRKIRNRRKAQEHWDKLRKYVMYTWGCKTLDDNYNNNKKEATCTDIFRPFHGNGSSRKQRQRSRMDSISLNQKASLPSQKNAIQESRDTQEIKSFLAGASSSAERSLSHPKNEAVLKKEVLGATKEGKQHVGSHEEDASQCKAFAPAAADVLPPPPMLGKKS